MLHSALWLQVLILLTHNESREGGSQDLVSQHPVLWAVQREGTGSAKAPASWAGSGEPKFCPRGLPQFLTQTQGRRSPGRPEAPLLGLCCPTMDIGVSAPRSTRHPAGGPGPASPPFWAPSTLVALHLQSPKSEHLLLCSEPSTGSHLQQPVVTFAKFFVSQPLLKIKLKTKVKFRTRHFLFHYISPSVLRNSTDCAVETLHSQISQKGVFTPWKLATTTNQAGLIGHFLDQCHPTEIQCKPHVWF